MAKVGRWIVRGLLGLAGLAIFAAAGAFTASEMMIRWPQAKAPVSVTAAHDPGAVARGRRIATLYGCHDCHGADLTGRLFFDQMPVAKIAGPNLSLLMARQSDQDLARAIRTGVAADGRPLWIMPSDAFARLSDAETADLLAYLRTFPAKGAPQTDKQIGPLGRVGVLAGKFRSAPAILREAHGVGPADLGAQHLQGRRLARACMECHGLDLKGSAVTGAPDLTIAGAYDPADFERLLRTGIAAGNRKLGLMSETAPGRFNAMTHDEIMALHAYLKARADQPSPPPRTVARL
ncbi:MAG TPA: c-type cytochrome [Phenylobacterium sp.]